MNPGERTRFKLQAGAVALATVLTASYASPSSTSEPQVDSRAFVRETMRTSEERGRLTYVWWIPEELWVSIIDQPTPLPDDQLGAFVELLHPYTIVAAGVVLPGSKGKMTFVDRNTLRQAVVLVDSSGRKYGPLPDDKVPPAALHLPDMFRVALTAIVGDMGQNIHFLFFPALAVSGARIADPYVQGEFSVRIGDDEFKWKTPLNALLPPKFCPKDGEEFPGSWSYCPWHGFKLTGTKPEE